MAFDNAFSPTSSFGYQRKFQTTLSGSITSTSTAIPLTTLPSDSEGVLVIEPGTSNEEVIFYNSSGAGNVNVPSAADGRGIYNTTAVAHNSGVTVKMLNEEALWEVLQSGGALSTKVKQGWLPLKVSGTYVSATQFTVSGDVTSLISIGYKLYLNNSGDKYFYVTAAPSYSGGSGLTTITVSGGTDYTLASAAISNIYFSNATNPYGHPLWFNYAFAAAGFSSFSTNVNRFSITGRTVNVQINITGTSNSTSFTGTLPIAAAYTTLSGTMRIADNSVGSFNGMLSFTAGSTALSLSTSAGGAGWTASNTKACNGYFSYEC